MANALNTLKFSDSVLKQSSSITIGHDTYNSPNVVLGNTALIEETSGDHRLVVRDINGNDAGLVLADHCGYERLTLGAGYDNGFVKFGDKYVIKVCNDDLSICDTCGNVGIRFSHYDGWGIEVEDCDMYFGEHCGYLEIIDQDYNETVFQAASGSVQMILFSTLDSLAFVGGGKIEIDANGFLKAACGLQ